MAEPAGWVDRTFGTAGATGVGEEQFTRFQTLMAADSLGRAVLAHHPDLDLPMSLSRLTPDGALDNGFGTAGRVGITDLLGANDAEWIATGPGDAVLAFHSTFGAYVARVTAG